MEGCWLLWKVLKVRIVMGVLSCYGGFGLFWKVTDVMEGSGSFGRLRLLWKVMFVMES